MAEEKLTLAALARMVKDTNARIDALAQVVTQQRQPEAPAVDEAALVEKVQAQVVRQILPAFEEIKSNQDKVIQAVSQAQQSQDQKIQTSVESIFRQNQQALNDALAAKMAELNQPNQSPGGTISAAAGERPSALGALGSLAQSVFAGAQMYPEGAKIIFGALGLGKPAPPPMGLLMDQMGQIVKAGDALDKMRHAAAEGKNIDEAIAQAKAAFSPKPE